MHLPRPSLARQAGVIHSQTGPVMGKVIEERYEEGHVDRQEFRGVTTIIQYKWEGGVLHSTITTEGAPSAPRLPPSARGPPDASPSGAVTHSAPVSTHAACRRQTRRVEQLPLGRAPSRRHPAHGRAKQFHQEPRRRAGAVHAHLHAHLVAAADWPRARTSICMTAHAITSELTLVLYCSSRFRHRGHGADNSPRSLQVSLARLGYRTHTPHRRATPPSHDTLRITVHFTCMCGSRLLGRLLLCLHYCSPCYLLISYML